MSKIFVSFSFLRVLKFSVSGRFYSTRGSFRSHKTINPGHLGGVLHPEETPGAVEGGVRERGGGGGGGGEREGGGR